MTGLVRSPKALGSRDDADTIAALATAPGRSGVAVIRVSGSEAGPILASMVGGLPPPRQAVLRSIRNRAGDRGEILDHGLVLWFPGPASFTGEDVAEFHLHGSPAVVAAVLAAVTGDGRARLARAGEFTERAVIHGRIPLQAAEALGALIDSETEQQRRLALRCLAAAPGSGGIASWREALVEMAMRLTASIDFADEADVEAGVARAVPEAMARLAEEMAASLGAGEAAERILGGFRVVITGAPNAGKSTLFNALLGEERAIVTPVPGTTRDRLEARLDLEGWAVTLIDTAGLRDADDPVEREGVARARMAAREADVVLSLAAPGMAFVPQDENGRASVIHLRTMADHGRSEDAQEIMAVSAVTGMGLPALRRRVADVLAARGAAAQDAVTATLRQRRCLERAVAALRAGGAVDSDAPELLAEHVRAASLALGELVGEVGIDEVLGAVFARFCVGK